MSDIVWGYVPTAYLDEQTPWPRPSPDDWLLRSADGAVHLAGAWSTGPDDVAGGTSLEPGDEIDFDRRTTVDVDTLVVNADGTWFLTGPEPNCPDGATFSIFESKGADYSETSVTDLAAAISETEELPYTCGITFAAWENASRTFVFNGTTFVERVSS